MSSSWASETWLTSQCANELREVNESGLSLKTGYLRRIMGEKDRKSGKDKETDTKVGGVTVTYVKCRKFIGC